jgi:hypothetical protein
VQCPLDTVSYASPSPLPLLSKSILPVNTTAYLITPGIYRKYCQRNMEVACNALEIEFKRIQNDLEFSLHRLQAEYKDR